MQVQSGNKQKDVLALQEGCMIYKCLSLSNDFMLPIWKRRRQWKAIAYWERAPARVTSDERYGRERGYEATGAARPQWPGWVLNTVSLHNPIT